MIENGESDWFARPLRFACNNNMLLGDGQNLELNFRLSSWLVRGGRGDWPPPGAYSLDSRTWVRPPPRREAMRGRFLQTLVSTRTRPKMAQLPRCRTQRHSYCVPDGYVATRLPRRLSLEIARRRRTTFRYTGRARRAVGGRTCVCLFRRHGVSRLFLREPTEDDWWPPTAN